MELEFLAQAYERAGRHIAAIDVRTGNTKRQGLNWVPVDVALNAIKEAMNAK